MDIKMNYFTSTGNTLWVANTLKALFEKYSSRVDLYDSVTCETNWHEKADMIGFVYPVWGSTMPNPQRDLLSHLPNSNGRKLFFIGNAGVFSGDTGIFYKEIAEEKGYDVVYADHVFLPINSVFPGFSFFRQPDEKKTLRMKEKAGRKLEQICTDIIDGKRRYNGTHFVQKIGGRGQRDHYDPIVDDFKKKMFIDNEKCCKCGLCYRICPQGAIEKTSSGSFRIDTEKCIFCLKCYNFCPLSCALKDKESADTNKFTRYKGLDNTVRPVMYR
ncbi:MAG TPA: EFR1 family ferrodoxin [Thermotogota bacterium]|nr:EFR1 family ferrodoxin [Thermotogota bacterium]